MSAIPKYTKQMPWSGTEEEKDVIDGVAESLGWHRTEVIRYILDKFFGMPDSRPKRGETVQEVIRRAVDRISPPADK